RQRLLVERTRSRRAHHAAVDDASLPVEAEEDLGGPLLVTGLRGLGVAFVAFEQRQDLRFPRRHGARPVGGRPASRGRRRQCRRLLGKRLRRRCRRHWRSRGLRLGARGLPIGRGERRRGVGGGAVLRGGRPPRAPGGLFFPFFVFFYP